MGDATISLDARTAAAHAPDTPPPPTQEEALVDVEEIQRRLYSSATSKRQLEEYDNLSAMQTETIHRFPHHLMGIGGEDRRYVVPSVVAIGPNHHGQPHLQAMEEVKKAAVTKFCGHFDLSLAEVHKRIASVASDARRCYNSSATQRMTEEEFAGMLLVDGCFLMWLMVGNTDDDPQMVGCSLSFGPSFLRDIFLLENQIPWMVLHTLMVLTGQRKDRVVLHFFLQAAEGLRHAPPRTIRSSRSGTVYVGDMEEQEEDYKPPHLLGILWYVLRHTLMPPHNKGDSKHQAPPGVVRRPSGPIGAVELTHAGFKITASAGLFAHMECHKKKLPFVTGELSLSPLFLDETMACSLVNLAALESVQAINLVSCDVDGYAVSSYVSMLAMLVVSEEDVHVLRRSGVLISNFSDAQTLAFFKGLSQHLRLGYKFLNTMVEINECLRNRKVSIAIRKFVYNNYKTIAAVLSIAGALIGVLKALYSLKKP